MYEKRFGLHRKPFQSVLTDHDFFQSETIHEILPAVLHALKSDLGVAVLTGPSGVGKSVTLDHLRRSLATSCQTVLIRGGTVHCAADLLFLLHRKLLKCQTQDADNSSLSSSNVIRRWEVVERLERIVGFWGPLIVLLDDAHLVPPVVFSELRALLEEDFAGQKLLRLLIAGPLLLEEVLAEPDHVDFAQKIRTHVFLQPLHSAEAVAYLNHQLSCAGATLTAVMDNAAVERIVVAADGIPRCLNLLADESLVICDENQAAKVTRGIVDQALTRLQHLPYPWNVSLHEHDAMELDHSESDATFTHSKTANSPVTEPGVIEIGEPASPTRPTHAIPSATRTTANFPAPRTSGDSIRMEDGTGCIEIGGPAESAEARPVTQPDTEGDSQPASESSEIVQKFSAASNTFAAVEEAWTETMSLDSKADESSDSINAALPEPDPSVAEADSFWTATEVTAEEFFQHEESLAEFDDSDDAIMSTSDNERPLVDQSLFPVRAIDERLFETHSPHDRSSQDFGDGSVQNTQEFQSAESGGGEPQTVASFTSNVASDAITISDEFLPETDSSCENEFTDFLSCGPDATNPLPEIIAGQTTPDASSDSESEGQESASSNCSEEKPPELPHYELERHTPHDDESDDHPLITNSTADDQPELETFQPWQPAGSWPAATVARPARVSTQSTALNALPVFDRYTWCELGRTVSPSQRSRPDISLPLMSCAQWPPSTLGIAPEDSVSVVDLQDDYAELLTDLGMLIDATSDNDGQAHGTIAVRDDLFLPGSDQNDACTPDHERDPEAALDRIQHLLESEHGDRSPAMSSTQTSAGGSDSQDATSDSAEDDAATEHDLLAFDAGSADSRGWSLVDDSEGRTGPGSLSFLNEIFDAAQRPDPLTFGTDEFAAEGRPESDHVSPPRDPRNLGTAHRDVPQEDPYPVYLDRVICDDDREVSLVDEGQLQNEDDQIQQQQYLPQLLRQARQRISARSVHGGQLRQAAGAESVSAVTDSQTVEAASSKPRLSISSVVDEDEEPQSGSQNDQTLDSNLNFRNLFTRLRQRDKRA